MAAGHAAWVHERSALPSNDGIAYNAIMAAEHSKSTTLIVRNVDAALKASLRIRAARNGRSMEAELRTILSDTLAGDVATEPNLAEAIRRRFAPFGGVELVPHPPVSAPKPPQFD